jgi:hypothetical protein
MYPISTVDLCYYNYCDVSCTDEDCDHYKNSHLLDVEIEFKENGYQIVGGYSSDPVYEDVNNIHT